jgi:uncharacterized protein
MNLRKIAVSLLRILVLLVVAVVLLLIFFQHQMIYHPRPYREPVSSLLGPFARVLSFSTKQGKQQAYYLPPIEGGMPERLWVIFNGNGSLALDWVRFRDWSHTARDGWLLVEFPGYGACEGSASPESIRANAAAAVQELATATGVDANDPKTRLCVMGYSIGCGPALEFAVAHPVEKVVLSAPFTSLVDMARLRVGWPLCLLLRQNFDNSARLDELARRSSPPHVDIFHGDHDELIPQRMGITLAKRHPQMIRFHPVPEAQHNNIIDEASSEILRVMGEP